MTELDGNDNKTSVSWVFAETSSQMKPL